MTNKTCHTCIYFTKTKLGLVRCKKHDVLTYKDSVCSKWESKSMFRRWLVSMDLLSIIVGVVSLLIMGIMIGYAWCYFHIGHQLDTLTIQPYYSSEMENKNAETFRNSN